MSQNNNKFIFPFDKIILSALLAIIGFFSMQTYYSIKNLEKDVVTIRIKLAEFEAKRISREEIEHIIKNYHDTHPCINKNNK